MKLLTGNVNYTVNDLAERLDTSYRSIYRYIETFKDAGFVIHKLEGGVYKLGKESITLQTTVYGRESIYADACNGTCCS